MLERLFRHGPKREAAQHPLTLTDKIRADSLSHSPELQRLGSRFLTLSQTIRAIGESETVQGQVDSLINRYKTPTEHFYRDLMRTLYEDETLRPVVMEDIKRVIREESDQRVENFLHQDTGKRVLIVGGGGSGLTAARTLLDKGLTPLVLEKSGRLDGGQFIERKLPFPLLNPARIKGPRVLIQPQKLSRTDGNMNYAYADAVVINAFFADVPIAVGREVKRSSPTDTPIVRQAKDSPYTVTIRKAPAGNETIIADKIVFAPGIGDAVYGHLKPLEVAHIAKLAQDLRKRVYTAQTFLDRAYTINEALQKGGDEAIRQAKQLATFLTEGVAIVGTGWSLEQQLHNIFYLLNEAYEKKYLTIDDLLPVMKQGKITIYGTADRRGGRLDSAIESLTYTYPVLRNIIHSVLTNKNLGYQRDNFLYRDVLRIDASENAEHPIHVRSARQIASDPIISENYGFVLFTGYRPDTFKDLLRSVRTEGIAIFDEATIRALNTFRNLGDLWYVGPSMFPTKTVIHELRGTTPPPRADIIRDGERTVDLMHTLARTLKRKN